MSDELIERAQRWMQDDPDPETRDELAALIAACDLNELANRFGSPLSFGTAGLRGLLGAGPSRMNRSVVARTTAGLCAHLSTLAAVGTRRSLCIGFDGRRKSRELAREAAAVALGAGFDVLAFEQVVPTPLVAHAVPFLRADAGVMITASHNPPAYNGYKVYSSNGVQLLAPHDRAVLAASTSVASVMSIARLDPLQALQDGRMRHVDAEVAAHYMKQLVLAVPTLDAEVPLTIAYTALHGVGQSFALRALNAIGIDDVQVVAEQGAPDGAFPTVDQPNPEEPSAMTRVLRLAQTINADLALANDPDADRLAVAARDRDGIVRMLNGNQVGLLLTEHALRHATEPTRQCVLTSIVTTTLAASIAHAFGAHWEATLTGTKWICHRAFELETEEGLQCAIGFEEAIGYCVGNLVREKDGIGALAHVARMAQECKAQGRTLHDELERISRRYGLSVTRPLSLSLEGGDALARVAPMLRALATHPPSTIAGAGVERVIDLSLGQTLPPTPGVILELHGGHRICVRPSGTEPKLKCYLEAHFAVTASDDLVTVERAANAWLDEASQMLAERLTT